MQVPDQQKLKYQHLENLFKRLNDFKDKKRFCDVSIKVPGNAMDPEMNFDSHRIILAANSIYFESMFNTGFSLSGDKAVSLIGVTSTEFKKILQFFYSGQLSVNQSTISLILQASDFLQIDSITKILLKHIKKYHFSLEESLNHLDFMMTTFEKQVGVDFSKTVLRNFHYCLQNDKYRSLLLSTNYNIIKYLLSSEVNDASETDLLDFLLEWIDVNSFDKQESYNQLLGLIRINHAVPEDIQKVLQVRKEVFGRLKGDFVDNVKLRASGKNADSIMEPRNGSYYYIMFLNNESRIYYDVNKNCFVKESEDEIISGLEKIVKGDSAKREYFSSLDLTNGNLSGLLHYSPEEMKLPSYMRYDNKVWQENYKCALSIESYLKLGHCIIHVGGWDENRHLFLKGCAIYGQGPWKLFGSMSKRRGSHALVIESGIVYAIGGKNEEEALDSVECLQINGLSKEWKTLAPLPTGRHSTAVAFLDKKIYLFGGYSEPTDVGKCLQNHLVYDVKENTWTEMPATENFTKVHVATTCFGKIYLAVTLAKGSDKLTIMEYDPVKETWTKKAEEKFQKTAKYATKFSKYDYFEV